MMDTKKDPPAPPAFEGWAIVEIMGHRRHFGMVREVELFGGKMCRVDVPEAPAVERDVSNYWRMEVEVAGQTLSSSSSGGTRETVPAAPPQTFLYGPAAIFGITPCTEEVVRKALEREQYSRSLPVSLASLSAVGQSSGESEDGDIDVGGFEDEDGEGP